MFFVGMSIAAFGVVCVTGEQVAGRLVFFTISAMSPDLFIVALFTLLALWLGIGIFSSRPHQSPIVRSVVSQLAAMSKRGINDVALCGSCGVAVGSISIVAEQNDHDALSEP